MSHVSVFLNGEEEAYLEWLIALRKKLQRDAAELQDLEAQAEGITSGLMPEPAVLGRPKSKFAISEQQQDQMLRISKSKGLEAANKFRAECEQHFKNQAEANKVQRAEQLKKKLEASRPKIADLREVMRPTKSNIIAEAVLRGLKSIVEEEKDKPTMKEIKDWQARKEAAEKIIADSLCTSRAPAALTPQAPGPRRKF